MIREEVTEPLDYRPASFFVRRQVRPVCACRGCETVVSPELPSQPIDKGLPGPGLLAQVLVNKYGDHRPLYRQQGIFARHGVDPLGGWMAPSTGLLSPLAEAL